MRALRVGPAPHRATRARRARARGRCRGRGCENPHSGPVRSRSVRERSALTLKSPARTTTSSGRASDDGEPGCAQQLGVGQPLVGRIARAVHVRDADRSCRRRRRAARPARSAAPSPRRAARRRRAPAREPARRGSAAGSASAPGGRASRSVPPRIMAFPWPENAERKRPWFGSVSARPSRRVIGSGPSTGRAASVSDREACRAPTPAPPARRARRGRRPWRGGASRRGRHDAAAAWCCRGRGSSCGRARDYATSVRVLLADPPAFTPWYDHELAAGARARRRGRRVADVALPLRRRPAARRLPRAASASTRSRRGSSSARARGCR